MACKTTIQTEIELHLRNLDNAWQKFTFISFSIVNPLIPESDWLLPGANRYLVVVVVGLCQSLPLSITLTLRVARWNHVLTRVAIFNKGFVVQLVLNHTWWQRSLTLKMLDAAAVSHQQTLGLPSGAQENKINPQQPSQLPLPAKFDDAERAKTSRVLDEMDPSLPDSRINPNTSKPVPYCVPRLCRRHSSHSESTKKKLLMKKFALLSIVFSMFAAI